VSWTSGEIVVTLLSFIFLCFLGGDIEVIWEERKRDKERRKSESEKSRHDRHDSD